MKPYLLDVNVLLALAWPSHVHYAQAQRWFSRKRGAGFRTCPITQTGFARISSNPKFIADAVSPAQALALLGEITSLPGHGFWPDDLELRRAVSGTKWVPSHRQITDAYLVALAKARGGRFATLDRGVLALPGTPDLVELLA